MHEDAKKGTRRVVGFEVEPFRSVRVRLCVRVLIVDFEVEPFGFVCACVRACAVLLATRLSP